MFLHESVAMGWGLEEGKQENRSRGFGRGLHGRPQMKPVVGDRGGADVL